LISTEREINIVATQFVQAYQQAPWRLQLQSLGLFLLGLVAAVMIAGLYLNVTAQASAAGARIQELEAEKEELMIDIAGLRTELGELTSADNMRRRAEAMGFQPANMETAQYLVIPDYPGKNVVMLAPPPVQERPRTLILPAYKESLWDFLFKGALKLIEQQGGLAQ
jgi:hypothetical protein